MKVSITKCSSYDYVRAAVRRSVDELGGFRRFINPGDKVLLKINQLLALSSDTAATTHPAFVRAVALEVEDAGGIPFVGDSPGVDTLFEVAKKTGILDLGYPLVDLDDPITVERNGREFIISRKTGDFDVIINLPKLKTHTITGMTGAVKNMFGCVPGLQKSRYHKILQGDDFPDFFVLLERIISPDLIVMDSVIGMEGDGPSAGNPKAIGAVIAGTDSMSVDLICARILGFSDNEVSTIRRAKALFPGKISFEDIEIFGELFKIKDFKKPNRWSFRIHSRYPEIIKDACTACRDCEKICAVKAISVDQHAKIEYPRCISCFCCYEICRYNAIRLKKIPQ